MFEIRGSKNWKGISASALLVRNDDELNAKMLPPHIVQVLTIIVGQEEHL